MFNWLKRKPEPEPPKRYWVLPESPPLPPCPVHGDRCGTVYFDNKWFPTYEPCEAREAAIKRAEWNQTHEYSWNPTTGNFEPHEI
jgi:hypothetical protein